MRAPASVSVTRSREDKVSTVDGGGVATGFASDCATTNAASGVIVSELAGAAVAPASFLRHKPKVLTARPCSRQKRRAPIPLAAPCDEHLAPKSLALRRSSQCSLDTCCP